MPLRREKGFAFTIFNHQFVSNGQNASDQAKADWHVKQFLEKRLQFDNARVTHTIKEVSLLKNSSLWVYFCDNLKPLRLTLVRDSCLV